MTEVLGTKVGDKLIDISEMKNAQRVMFDTGTSVLSLSTIVYKELIRAANETSGYNCILVKTNVFCPIETEEEFEKYPNITYTLPGVEFNITPKHYMTTPFMDEETVKNYLFHFCLLTI